MLYHLHVPLCYGGNQLPLRQKRYYQGTSCPDWNERRIRYQLSAGLYENEFPQDVHELPVHHGHQRSLIIIVSSIAHTFSCVLDYKLNKIFFSLMIASMVIPFQVIAAIPLVSIYGGQLTC